MACSSLLNLQRDMLMSHCHMLAHGSGLFDMNWLLSQTLPSAAHTHTHTHTQSLSLSYTHTHIHTQTYKTQKCEYIGACSMACRTHSVLHTLFPSLTLFLSLTHTHTHTHTHQDTQSGVEAE